MNIRFIIRKQGDRKWTLRDGVCHKADHDFDYPRWAEGCTGACDVFWVFSSAIDTVDYTIRMEQR